jgi:hypothetical protein
VRLAEGHEPPAGVDEGGQPPRRSLDVRLTDEEARDLLGMQRGALTELGADPGQRIVGPTQVVQCVGVD